MENIIPPKPTLLSVLPENLPVELKQLNQWVVWKLEFVKGHWAKIPYQPDGILKAKADDPTTFGSYADALATYQRGGFDGIGFEFNDDFVAIDLDNKTRSTNTDEENALIDAEFSEIIKAFDSYTETSPSGTGVHIIIKACENPGTKWHTGRYEFYTHRRYFTFTGHTIPGCSTEIKDNPEALKWFYETHIDPPKPTATSKTSKPIDVSDENFTDEQIVDLLRRDKDAAQWEKIIDGLWQGTKYTSESESVAALIFKLAHYSRSPVQLDRLFRGSQLYNLSPDKWERVGADLIQKALDQVRGHMNGNGNGEEERDPEYLFNKSKRDDISQIKSAYQKLSPIFLQGLLGDIVRTIEPYSESDPAAIAINTLVMFSNVIGRNKKFMVEWTPHHLNLFVVLTGRTSVGRKGTSSSTITEMFRRIDPVWLSTRRATGLSSGEGLILMVADPHRAKNRKELNPGVTDKRLLVVENEFSSVLKMMTRPGNILSGCFRNAFDGIDLEVVTRNNPIKATAPHISFIGHITQSDLSNNLTDNDQSNGFGNRILWCFVERNKSIPTPVPPPWELLQPLVDRLSDALKFANDKSTPVMVRNADAEALWISVYEKLTTDRKGLAGSLLARAAPQVMRLSCLYALLDLSNEVRPEHLKAAIAFWNYLEVCTEHIFGNLTGDLCADRILGMLENADNNSMSSMDIVKAFSKHLSSKDLMISMNILTESGLIVSESIATPGRPKKVWRLNIARPTPQPTPTNVANTVNVFVTNNVTNSTPIETLNANVVIQLPANTMQICAKVEANNEVISSNVRAMRELLTGLGLKDNGVK